MERYLDTNLSAKERAKDLFSKLSLDEKMAQVVGVFSVKGREAEMTAFFQNGIGQREHGGGGCMAKGAATACDEEQSPSYPGSLSYGRLVRSFTARHHRFPLWSEPWLYL